MAYAFALGANEPLPQMKVSCTRDLEWFKEQLQKVGVSGLHIAWNAAEEFGSIKPELLDQYLLYRKHYFHAEALRRAQAGK